MPLVSNSQSTTLTSDDAITRGENIPTILIQTTSVPVSLIHPDIEHIAVEDDPRLWSNNRKNLILFVISAASTIAGLCTNIQNTANSRIQQELHTTVSDISFSLSLFILIQGNFPIVWSAVSEVKGRRSVYMLSVTLFTVSSAIIAMSETIGLVIGMRVVQAIGSSAVITTGTAALADIYDSPQRGTKIGVYYFAPTLGMAIAPFLGGGLTQGLGWRTVFWFQVVLGGVIFSAFLFLFKETFRKERSATYQTVSNGHIQEQEYKLDQEKNRERGDRPSNKEKRSEDGAFGTQVPRSDVEAQAVVTPTLAMDQVKLSLVNINPFPLYLRVLSRKDNLAIVIAAGLLFAFSFSISYTCGRTLSRYYDHDAMETGLVELTYGIGSMLGNILGGWWSDRTLSRLKTTNNGISYPEMRLESIRFVMWLFPPIVIGYAWVCQQHLHILAICATLLMSGFCMTWIYSSTLAYIVDANVGRSSTVVATVSASQGISAFVAAEMAVPIQDAIGDGGLYTLWAGVTLLAELMIWVVLYKGKQWREARVDAETRTHGS